MATFFDDLPPEIAAQYEAIERKKKIQNALMAQTLQQPQTQMGRSGRYQVAVPRSPLEGATKLIQAAMLSKASDKSNQAMKDLASQYQAGSGEEVRNMQAQATGSVPWRQPDPMGAVTTGAGSPYPAAQRVSDAMLMSQRAGGGQQARPTGTTTGYIQRGQSGGYEKIIDPDTGKPYMPAYADPSMRQQYQYGGAMGTGMAERALDKPAEQAGVEAQQRKQVFVSDLIKEAKDDSGYFTAGFIGKIGSFIPGTPQYNLSEKLGTIKANLGFDKLQEMRDASKTGGALGQISNREIDFLQSVWSSVEQGQSPGELDKNLTRVDAAIDAVVNGKVDKYNRLYPSDKYPTQSPAGYDADKERRYQQWKAKQLNAK